MNTRFALSFEFPNGEEKEIEFEAEFTKSGIGHYEYWGAKCYDAGRLELDSINYNEDDFTVEECKYIEDSILDSQTVVDKAYETLDNA